MTMSHSGIPNPRHHAILSNASSAIPTGRLTPVQPQPPSGRLTPSGRSTPSQQPLASSTSSTNNPSTTARSFTPNTLQSNSRSNTPSAIPSRNSLQLSGGLHRATSSSSPNIPAPSSPPTPTDSSGSTTVQVILRIRPSSYDLNVPTRFQRTVINQVEFLLSVLLTLPSHSLPPPAPPQINPTTVSVESPPPGSTLTTQSNAKSSQTFIFDRVFGPEDGQQKLWTSVENLINRFLEGYNVTIFAYGQTSSGKSYTMGTDRFSDEELSQEHLDQPLKSSRTGIIPRAIHTIFNKIQDHSTRSNQITVKASYIEVYNEELIDLIASSSSSSNTLPQVTIREDKDGTIICSGLKEVKVSKATEALDLLGQGSLVRQTNSTEMNAQSSRSHAIFTLNLSQSKSLGSNHSSQTSKRTSKICNPSGRDSLDEAEWSTVTSKLHFVDLAGSERLKRTAAVGGRVKEGISINAGLHALGNVISALGDPAKSKTVTHIPYRDSKLTRLLQDSLGGNANTMMIACVSPIEHNLNETLNTLKYANRARNIKNRAHLNAQEVGWEDVEYLQSTITKLRKELAQIKLGTSTSEFAHPNRVLSSIHEEDSVLDERHPKYLDLKGHFTELQAKYAKTLSDLAQAQHNLQLAYRQSGQPQNLSQSDFDDMIQPIVEEYEKSITALESQLALTKAALVHSEHSMDELGIQLANEQTINENQSNYLMDLQTRLNRLIERESENESYIRNLEVKVKTLSESEEYNNELVADLQKEVARLKEQDANSEAYIKDLESKLSRNTSADLSEQLASLEAALADRDDRYAELQAKFQALMSRSNNNNTNSDLWDEQHRLVKLLSEKEAALNDLQTALNEKNDMEIERQNLEASNAEKSRPVTKLVGRVKLLGSSTHERSSSIGSDVERRSNHLSAAPNFTPPDTPAPTPAVASVPAPTSSDGKGEDDLELLNEFHELQERYETTAHELDQVTAKYNNSLKELEDMTAQLEDLRVIQSSTCMPTPRRSLTNSSGHIRYSGSNFASPAPSPVLQSLSFIHPAASHSGILPVRGFGAPITAGRSSKYMEGKGSRIVDNDSREELDLNAQTGSQDAFEGLPNVAILSRDSNSHRSVSIGASNMRPLNRLSSGSSSGSLLPHGRSMSLSLTTDPAAYARAKNVARTSSDSRTFPASRLADQLTPTHSSEQSYESLQKEVIKLQEVLKEREDEIRNLEISIREIRRWSDTVTPPQLRSSPAESDQDGKSTPEDSRPANNTTVESDNEVAKEISSLAPSGKAFETIHSELLSKVKAGNASKDSQNIQFLDDLMRSMAQKESAHLELIENLKNKLDSTKRQHDELVKLSRDQVVNMSSEIEALRHRLTQPQTSDPDVADRLSKLDELLRSKEQELENTKTETKSRMSELEAQLLATKQTEIETLKAQHGSEMEKLMLEQRRNLNQLIEESEEKVKSVQGELQRLEAGWQVKLKDELAAQASKIRAEFEDQRNKLIEAHAKAQEKALQDQQARFDTETHQLLDQHAIAIEKLDAEHAQSLKRQQSDFEAQMKDLKQSHASEVTRITTALCSRASEGSNTLEKLVTGHQTELDELRTSILVRLKAQRSESEAEKNQLIQQHQELIKSMQGQHEAELANLKAEHEEILVASLTELDLRRTRKFEASLRLLQEKHAAEIEETKLSHQKHLESLASSPTSQDDDVTIKQNLDLEKIKDSYEEKIEMLKFQHQADLQTLEEQILASTLSSDLQEERQANQREIDVLTDELDYLKEEIQKHKANENHDSNHEAGQSEAEVELREALDALSTLDKALLESQAERERLLKELDEMKKLNSSDQQTLVKDMAQLRCEFDRVKQERDRLLQRKETSNPDQPGRTSSDGLNVRSTPGLSTESPSLPGLGTRTQQLLSSAKPPPPTPPPSIPPPPLPTSANNNNNNNLPTLNGTSSSVNTTNANLKPTRTSNSSSQLSQTNNSTSGRDSPSTSVATSSCLVDSVHVDPRMVKKIEEQENAIAKLSKQLSQCEIDLKGNIELVSNLESALNETERNLRKSRLQMNELAKERDKIATQNESLRKELSEANLELENARSNVLAEKLQFENQLGEERRAKENAKKQLEARMEEMQASRMTRKSKFNCF